MSLEPSYLHVKIGTKENSSRDQENLQTLVNSNFSFQFQTSVFVCFVVIFHEHMSCHVKSAAAVFLPAAA